MLGKLIRTIRKKPKPVRDNIALSIASGFTIVILGFWAYHLPSRLQVSEIVPTESTSAFSTFFDTAKDQFATVRESMRESTAGLNELTSTSSVGAMATTSELQLLVNVESVGSTTASTTATSSIPASSTNITTDSSQPRVVRILPIAASSSASSSVSAN